MSVIRYRSKSADLIWHRTSSEDSSPAFAAAACILVIASRSVQLYAAWTLAIAITADSSVRLICGFLEEIDDPIVKYISINVKKYISQNQYVRSAKTASS